MRCCNHKQVDLSLLSETLEKYAGDERETSCFTANARYAAPFSPGTKPESSRSAEAIIEPAELSRSSPGAP